MTERRLTANEWVKCIDPEKSLAYLIPIVEGSKWLMDNMEPITFTEFMQRAEDVRKWLGRSSADLADSATTFDPELEFEKTIDQFVKENRRADRAEPSQTGPGQIPGPVPDEQVIPSGPRRDD